MLNVIKTATIVTLAALSLTATLSTTANAQSVGALKDIAKSTVTDKTSSSVGGSALGGITGNSSLLGGLGSTAGSSNSLGRLGGIAGGSSDLSGLGSIAGGSSSFGSLGGVAGGAAGSLSNKEKLTAGKILLSGGSKTDVAVAVGKSRAKDTLKGKAGSFIK